MDYNESKGSTATETRRMLALQSDPDLGRRMLIEAMVFESDARMFEGQKDITKARYWYAYAHYFFFKTDNNLDAERCAGKISEMEHLLKTQGDASKKLGGWGADSETCL